MKERSTGTTNHTDQTVIVNTTIKQYARYPKRFSNKQTTGTFQQVLMIAFSVIIDSENETQVQACSNTKRYMQIVR